MTFFYQRFRNISHGTQSRKDKQERQSFRSIFMQSWSESRLFEKARPKDKFKSTSNIRLILWSKLTKYGTRNQEIFLHFSFSTDIMTYKLWIPRFRPNNLFYPDLIQLSCRYAGEKDTKFYWNETRIPVVK